MVSAEDASAIDVDLLGCDEGALAAGKEGHDASDVGRQADAPEEFSLALCLELLL